MWDLNLQKQKVILTSQRCLQPLKWIKYIYLHKLDPNAEETKITLKVSHGTEHL